jgi:LmbE family N-acetylglucosaminyl deacetylase
MKDLIKNKKILTFLAHPDDEVLGAGGMIYEAHRLNSEIHIVIPATGIHARRNKESRPARTKALEKLRIDCNKALAVLGVSAKHIYLGEFDDNKMDRSSLLSVIYFLEKHIEKIGPHLIITHHFNCTNIDHQICYKAAVVATRPAKTRHINLLSCEIPSSTGYYRPAMWEPNVYINLSERAVDAKIEALRCYESEIRSDPHPRSPEVLKALAKVRGSESGFFYAEAFMMVKGFLE